MIIDAGVWISAVLTLDPHHETSRACLDSLQGNGGHVNVPNHFPIEVAATIARRTNDPELAKRALRTVTADLQILVEDVRSTMMSFAGELAAELGLSTSEALYAGLAYQWGATLMTWDDSFITRASPKIKIRRPNLAELM